MSSIPKITSSIGREVRYVRDAYRVGERCGHIKNKNPVLTGMKSVKKAVAKEAGTIPAAGAMIGAIVPIPGGAIIGYAGGKLLQKFLPRFLKFIK